MAVETRLAPKASKEGWETRSVGERHPLTRGAHLVTRRLPLSDDSVKPYFFCNVLLLFPHVGYEAMSSCSGFVVPTVPNPVSSSGSM